MAGKVISYQLSEPALGCIQTIRTLALRGVRTLEMGSKGRETAEDTLNYFDAILETMEHLFDD